MIYIGNYIGFFFYIGNFYLLEKHVAGKDTVKIEYKYVLERPKGNSFEPVYPFFLNFFDKYQIFFYRIPSGYSTSMFWHGQKATVSKRNTLFV